MLGGYFARDPVAVFNSGREGNLAALFVSGDAGLRFGTGPLVVKALADRGIPIVAVSSPPLFRTRKTKQEIASIITSQVRRALEQTKARQLVLIGQSYGADVLQTGLSSLPEDLRSRMALLILIVPGRGVFFRADPSGLLYFSTPDSDGTLTARTLTWLPVTCIYGRQETESLCPTVDQPNFTTIGMHGGHFLGHDATGLVDHVLSAVATVAPGGMRGRDQAR